MNMRMMLGAMMFIAAAIPGNAQTSQQPAGTPSPQAIEQGVANEIKEKQLRKEAEEKLAVEESNRIARLRPEDLLSSGRTFYIYSDTDFFEEVQLQNALRKRTELSDWQLSILDGWKSREVADVWVEVDRPLFTYTFTYQLIHRSTGKVLATGKVTAFDGNLAAPKLAARIIQDIKKAKESPKKQ